MFGKQVPPDLEAAWISFQKPATKPLVLTKKKREIKLEDAPIVVPDAADEAVNNATANLQPQAEARVALKKKARVEKQPEQVEPELVVREVVEKPGPAEIISMEAYNRRDNQLELFEANISHYHTPTSEMLSNPPPQIDPLGFALRNPTIFPWAPLLVNAVASNPLVGFPKSPTFSRVYIDDFLRRPSKTMRFERECINLNRAPAAHETLDICAAFELSTQLLGEGNGFKMREFLLNNEMIRIMEHLENKRVPPPGSLSEIPDLCFFCHLRHTYRLCLRQTNLDRQRRRKDLTVDAKPDTPMYSIFNRFKVIVDMEGEYTRDACISFDHVSIGLSGPFPRWNPNNYIIVDGRFVELDKVVFHQARSLREGDGVTASTPTSLTTAARKAVSNSRN